MHDRIQCGQGRGACGPIYKEAVHEVRREGAHRTGFLCPAWSPRHGQEDGVTVRTSNGSRDRIEVGRHHALWLSPAAFAGREPRVDPLHVLRSTKENAWRMGDEVLRGEARQLGATRQGCGPQWGTAGEGSSAAPRQQPANGVAQCEQSRENESGWTGRPHLRGLPPACPACPAYQKYAVGLCQAAGAPEQPAKVRGHQAAMAASPQARVRPPTISRRSASISCMKPKALDSIAAM
jgi:hypothetical protein